MRPQYTHVRAAVIAAVLTVLAACYADSSVSPTDSFRNPEPDVIAETTSAVGTISSVAVIGAAGAASTNTEPNAWISKPAHLSSWAAGASISFSGSGYDAEDGQLNDGSLVWTSDRDGQIGTGRTFSRNNLSGGSHTITLTGTDAQGASFSHNRVITVTGAPNTAPTASITTPTNNASVVLGATVSFAGAANDNESGALSGSALVWTSSRDGQIGTGASFSKTNLTVGTHTITLTAKDPQNAAGTAIRSITVTAPVANTAPAATISAPANGVSVAQGANVTFTGSANDAESGTLSGSALVWSSSASGQIGTGASVSTSALAVGTHTITLTATDPQGAVGTAVRTLTIAASTAPNQEPFGLISTPVHNSTFVQGAAISFTGSSSDPEDGALSGAALVWKSSRDGQIGTGTSFTKSNLTVGTHTITFTSTDSRGASFSHNRVIAITASIANTAPAATITAPANGVTVTQGASVAFAGSASDAESGALTGASLVWTSNRDGQIGTGTSFSKTNLTVGTHTITLTARDAQNVADTATRTITVSATAPTNTPPVANFAANCLLLVCSFDASSSTDNAGIVQYAWNFGSGIINRTTALISNTFLVIGTVNVTLTVSDAAGLTSTITKAVTVSSGTPPSGGGGIEPAGMTKLAENDFSCFSACGNGWFYSQDYANASQVVQDAVAPRSGGSVVQQNFTPTLVPGSSPASVGTGISAKKTVYTSIWMKMSSNYVGHASGTNKVIHFYTASRTSAENIAIFSLRGAGTGALSPTFILQNLAGLYRWSDPNGTSYLLNTANLEPNLAQCRTTRGQWARYEMVLTSNTPGVADGRAELWMNGTKCSDYTGITYAASGTDSRWNQVNWSPTYGGAGGTVTTSFFAQVDHIYVSGK